MTIYAGDHYACCAISHNLVRIDINSSRKELVEHSQDWQRVAAVMSLDEARRFAVQLTNAIADANRLAALRARRK